MGQTTVCILIFGPLLTPALNRMCFRVSLFIKELWCTFTGVMTSSPIQIFFLLLCSKLWPKQTTLMTSAHWLHLETSFRDWNKQRLIVLFVVYVSIYIYFLLISTAIILCWGWTIDLWQSDLLLNSKAIWISTTNEAQSLVLTFMFVFGPCKHWFFKNILHILSITVINGIRVPFPSTKRILLIPDKLEIILLNFSLKISNIRIATFLLKDKQHIKHVVALIYFNNATLVRTKIK